MAATHTGDTVRGSEQGAAYCQQMRLLLERVGERWSLLAVIALRAQALRFNALRRELQGISPRMLARTLKALERDCLVSRTVHPTVPPQVDYALTALGRSLLQPVDALLHWADEHREAMDMARRDFDAREAVAAAT
ncbi:transcriptional regulator [Stenotrophomonas sp. ATCM1_4]|uniref:winged helix-turn-helix transcriptional regulator n=1 Tax=Stenotrophomonas sp. ATCM1_4 TaxID=2259330 RepID=UPI0010450179|nr:helix-turn-helix domain-containing protein [Stenotrophomonas sp. ATCM1_4]TDB29798.1 transcriptional regulator [Stenotrophomonas sp. ATCM1_4]